MIAALEVEAAGGGATTALPGVPAPHVGEGRGEGQPQTSALGFAPHPNPLPARGEGPARRGNPPASTPAAPGTMRPSSRARPCASASASLAPRSSSSRTRPSWSSPAGAWRSRRATISCSAAPRRESARSSARPPTRCCWRCSTTSSCRSPSRWARRCATRRSRSTSRSGSTSPAPCSTPTGELVANAPHMPVHLGSMDRSVETVIRANAGQMRPGDVYMLNAPYNGGTHLPDITVITPVFCGVSPPLPVVPRLHAWGGARGEGQPQTPALSIPPLTLALSPRGGGETRRERRNPLLRRQPRPSRGHRRADPRLHDAARHHHRGGGRLHRQLQAGRPGPLPGGRDARAAVGREVSRAHAGQEHRRPQGARGSQRQGRRRAGEDGRPLRPRRGEGLHGPRAGQRRGERAPAAVAAGGRRIPRRDGPGHAGWT